MCFLRLAAQLHCLILVAASLGLLGKGTAAADGAGNPSHAGAEGSDAQLLALAKARGELVRITAEPVKISAALSALCRAANPDPSKADPHAGHFVQVYANVSAESPMWDPFERFPVGAVVLKEKLGSQAPGAKPELFTGMVKRAAGFAPEGGDWEYFTLDGELTKVTSRGKLQSCAECHQSHAASDYVTKESAARQSLTGDGAVVRQGSGSTIFLPARLAQTHGSKLSRNEAREAWKKANPSASSAPPEDMSAVGGPKLRYEPIEKKNTLGFWVNAADWAHWDFEVAQPGAYVVQVFQGCGKGSGGAEVEVECAGRKLSFVVEDTGHFQNFTWREVGRVAFPESGRQMLVLRPKSKPGVAVMDVRQVRLVRTK